MTAGTGQLTATVVDLSGTPYREPERHRAVRALDRERRAQLLRRAAAACGRITANRPRAVLVLGLLAIAVFHLVVLVGPGEPSGLDYGNWLTFGHRWLGRGAPGGSESIYPPVVPLLVVGAVRVFGPVWGEGLLTSVVALAPALAVGTVLRGRVVPSIAVAMVLLVAAGEATGEAAAWGGLPQLLALGTGLIALWRLVLLLREPSPRSAWVVGGWLFATALISHLLLAQVAACGLLVVVGHAAFVRTGLTLRGPWAGRSGIPALTARALAALLLMAPLYWTLTRTVGASVVSRSDSSFHVLLLSIGGVFRDAPWAWLPAAMITALTPLLWSRRKDPLWLLVSAILVADVLVTLETGEARLAYMMPLEVACGLGLWSTLVTGLQFRRRQLVRATATTALVALTATLVTAGLTMFPGQRAYYGNRLLLPGTVRAIDWLRASTPANALVAVAPVRGLPFGWWVEGLGRRATLTGSSDLYLNFPDERNRAREAVALYSLRPTQTNLLIQQCARLGVSYLFVPSDWGGLSDSAVGALAAAAPASVVYANPGAMILKVAA